MMSKFKVPPYSYKSGDKNPFTYYEKANSLAIIILETRLATSIRTKFWDNFLIIVFRAWKTRSSLQQKIIVWFVLIIFLKMQCSWKSFSGVFKRGLVLFSVNNNFSRFFYFSYIFIISCTTAKAYTINGARTVYIC